MSSLPEATSLSLPGILVQDPKGSVSMADTYGPDQSIQQQECE